MQQLLVSIIEQNPAVIRLALSASARAALPSAVQAYVEEEMELDGELEILHEDRDVGSRYLYFLESGSARYSLHFANHEPTHLLTGAKIRVRGVRLETMLAVGGDTTTVQTLAPAPLPNSFGDQRTLVILVNFRDNPTQLYTVDFANNVFFGTTSNFFLENSYQQTYLSGVIKGWYTIEPS